MVMSYIVHWETVRLLLLRRPLEDSRTSNTCTAESIRTALNLEMALFIRAWSIIIAHSIQTQKRDKSHQTLLLYTRYWERSALGFIGPGNETKFGKENFVFPKQVSSWKSNSLLPPKKLTSDWLTVLTQDHLLYPTCTCAQQGNYSGRKCVQVRDRNNLVSLITGILITGLDFYTLGYTITEVLPEGTLWVAQGPRAMTCILEYLWPPVFILSVRILSSVHVCPTNIFSF